MTSKGMASCTCHQLVRLVEHADTHDGAAVHATSLTRGLERAAQAWEAWQRDAAGGSRGCRA